MVQEVNQFSQGVEKGQLDLKTIPNIYQCRVSTNELLPGQAVKIVDTDQGVPVVDAAGDTDEVFGYVPLSIKNGDAIKAGQMTPIASVGSIMYMEAGAAFAPLAELMFVLATKKVITATGATKVISGYAIDKAVADTDLVRVFITAPSFKNAPA